jgi:hypothetical protein
MNRGDRGCPDWTDEVTQFKRRGRDVGKNERVERRKRQRRTSRKGVQRCREQKKRKLGRTRFGELRELITRNCLHGIYCACCVPVI